MLKIRRSCNRLIFNMGIPIPGKDSPYIERDPGCCFHLVVRLRKSQSSQQCYNFSRHSLSGGVLSSPIDVRVFLWVLLMFPLCAIMPRHGCIDVEGRVSLGWLIHTDWIFCHSAQLAPTCLDHGNGSQTTIGRKYIGGLMQVTPLLRQWRYRSLLPSH